MKTNYATEFPDFGPLPAMVAKALADGLLADLSWHNDACPSFVRVGDVETVNRDGSADRVPVLWVQYEDASKREDGSCETRFLVTSPSFATKGNGCFETNDEADAMRRLMGHPDATE